MSADEDSETGSPRDDATEWVAAGAADASERTIGVQPGLHEPGANAGFGFGPYRVLRELGRGGMGIVYLAEDPALKRRVALKVLPRSSLGDPAQLARFRREAEVASRLEHPGLCGVLRVGESDGVPWIAMRYVEGESLADLVRDRRTASFGSSATTQTGGVARGEFGPRLQVIETIARALHEAHQAGVVHRDLKPGNVMIQKDGQPVVLDFGLALDLLGGDGADLTQSGDVLGTPYYMAPEQIRGASHLADPRVDVWALGVMLFELIAGARPFVGATRDALYRAILEDEPTALRKVAPGAPRDLETIVATALQKAPERRYESARALAEDLRALLEIRPIKARPVGLAERTIKAARRRPALATLVLVAAVALPAVAGLLAARAEDRARITRELTAAHRGALAHLDDGQVEAAAADLDTLRRIGGEAAFLPELEARLERERDLVRLRTLALDDEGDPGGERALAVAARLLDRGGETAEPLLWRALVELRRGDQEAARRSLATIGAEFAARLDLDAEDLAARPIRGDLLGRLEVALLARRQRPREALARIELMLEAAPRDAGLAWLAAEQASRMQDFRSALAQAGRARALVGELSPLQKGRYSVHLRRAGHPEEALRLTEQAIAVAPDDVIVRLHHASALDECGRKEEAITAYEQVEGAAPDLVLAFRNHAAALIDLGRQEEAIPILRRALALSPDDPDCLVNLASALCGIDRAEEALGLYDRALELRPDFPFALNNRAVALKELERYPEAETSARRALELRPDYGECWHNLGTVLVALGRNDEALEAFEKALAGEPDLEPALSGAAIVHLKAGRFEQALALFERALASDSCCQKAWLHLPLVYEGLGRSEDAIAAGETAIDLWPAEAQAWLNHGSVVINAGQRDAARPLFLEALELFPGEGRVSLILVVLLAESDIEGATACVLRLEDRKDPFFQHVAQFVDTLVSSLPTVAPDRLLARACALRVGAGDGLDAAETAALVALAAELEKAPEPAAALDYVESIAAAATLAGLADQAGQTELAAKARALRDGLEGRLERTAAAARSAAEEKAARRRSSFVRGS